jgi:hypothetical protein
MSIYIYLGGEKREEEERRRRRRRRRKVQGCLLLGREGERGFVY